jgi:hypothetical protein
MTHAVDVRRRERVAEADLRLMHHALGCPEGRWIKPYRNYFAIEADSDTARRFMETGRWIKNRLTVAGGLSLYSVTEDGIEEVFSWLDDRNKAKGLRPYEVTSLRANDHATRIVLARSRAAAKFAYYHEISDVWPGGFAHWLRQMQPRVRLAALNAYREGKR